MENNFNSDSGNGISSGSSNSSCDSNNDNSKNNSSNSSGSNSKNNTISSNAKNNSSNSGSGSGNSNSKNNNSKTKTMGSKTSFTARMLKNRYYPLVFLIIIVFVSVGLVMLLSNATEAKIIAQREKEIISQFKVIFPDIQDYNLRDEYYEIYSGGAITGYAFIAKGQGYGGEISILVGINSGFAIKKITVIANTETPGLGTKISESFFIDQFAGLSSSEISLAKDGGKIDAITGATVSSRAVVNAVSDQFEAIVEIIKGEQK